MTIVMAILSTFGAGLGSLFSWIVALFQKRAQDQQAATDQMNNDIANHAGDGAKSVSDSDSVDWQLGNIDDKLKQIDAQPPVKPTTGGK